MVYKSLSRLAPDYLRAIFSDRNDTCTYSLMESAGKLAFLLPRINFLKTALAIDARCCGTVYLSKCGKRKLSLALSPAAAVSFLTRINVNINTRHSWKASISFIRSLL